jgi:hypothetical protein
MGYRLIDGSGALQTGVDRLSSRRIGGRQLRSFRPLGIRLTLFKGLPLLLFFLLPRFPGELFLPPDLMIICFCHRPLYAFARSRTRLFTFPAGRFDPPRCVPDSNPRALKRSTGARVTHRSRSGSEA